MTRQQLVKFTSHEQVKTTINTEVTLIIMDILKSIKNNKR